MKQITNCSLDNHDSDIAELYMSDRQGRRVTPQIVPSDSESSRKRSKAEQSQRAAELKKRQIGLGVDKVGARLVNDKRRQGFLDDDDTMEIVDEED